MKKIVTSLLLLLAMLATLTSCALDVPRPEIKEGRFNISVTYEHNGEIKTASAVYVCEYDGVIWYNPNRDPFVYWKESFEGDITEYGEIPVCTTDDGGEIIINVFPYPEYFMGDPDYQESEPFVWVELCYPDDQINDEEIIAEYGVRLISWECDAPIVNTFKPLV